MKKSDKEALIAFKLTIFGLTVLSAITWIFLCEKVKPLPAVVNFFIGSSILLFFGSFALISAIKDLKKLG